MTKLVLVSLLLTFCYVTTSLLLQEIKYLKQEVAYLQERLKYEGTYEIRH